MDMDGLQDSVVRMLAGESVSINIGTFSNDMTTFTSKDDILTLLVHLGYLTYNIINGTVTIPNKEVSQEYINAISTMHCDVVANSVEDSRKFLLAVQSNSHSILQENTTPLSVNCLLEKALLIYV